MNIAFIYFSPFIQRRGGAMFGHYRFPVYKIDEEEDDDEPEEDNDFDEDWEDEDEE